MTCPCCVGGTLCFVDEFGFKYENKCLHCGATGVVVPHQISNPFVSEVGHGVSKSNANRT
jgi:hypothetical protein